MTDIVEQTADVLDQHEWRGSKCYCGKNHGGYHAEHLAQVLADAGLLREPTTDELWDKLMDGEEESVGPITADDINRASGAKFAPPARTVPTRDEIAAVLSKHQYEVAYGGCSCGADFEDGTETVQAEREAYDQHAADVILALLPGQPTVAEVKAQALEEFATHIENTTRRNDVRLIEYVVNDAGGAHLARERAQQIRDGK